jgi:hypothetical protein
MSIPAGARKLAPGVYDHDGELHVDFEEFIRAAGGNPASPADRETAERAIRRVAARQGIPVEERDKR